MAHRLDVHIKLISRHCCLNTEREKHLKPQQRRLQYGTIFPIVKLSHFSRRPDKSAAPAVVVRAATLLFSYTTYILTSLSTPNHTVCIISRLEIHSKATPAKEEENLSSHHVLKFDV